MSNGRSIVVVTLAVLTVAILLLLFLLLPAFAEESVDEVPYPHGDFVDDCETCHGPDGWVPAVIGEGFDHGRYGFPLTGSHVTTSCRSCHSSLEFTLASSPCVDCHLDVHRGELGTDCALCHSTRNFIDRADEVLMHRMSRFPLSAAHLAVDCEGCHPLQPEGGLQYVNTPVECEACHLSDFLATTNPNHVEAGFDRDCSLCHSAIVWPRARFDHDASGFPLTGAHRGIGCNPCHTGGVFAALPSDCFSCHADDYQQASGHVSGGFSQNCDDCHSTTTWDGATFDHSFFALNGGHAGLDCAQCHTSGEPGPIPSDCYSCHSDDYQQAPGHVSGSYSQSCDDCHSTATWDGATFDHPFFPLAGGHAGLGCQQCHTSGDPGPIPADCYSCHSADYLQAPDHQALNFSQDCESCHDTTIWSDVDFSHSFPLAGPHNRSCTDCHTTGSTATFSCEGLCHEHTQSEMADDHSEVNGYSFDSLACYSCHPDGSH
jgi:hypothetical protein